MSHRSPVLREALHWSSLSGVASVRTSERSLPMDVSTAELSADASTHYLGISTFWKFWFQDIFLCHENRNSHQNSHLSKTQKATSRVASITC